MAPQPIHISIERLRELFDYDPLTGAFTRRVTISGGGKAGSAAGSLEQGYFRVGIERRRYMVHRLAWMHYYGEWPDCEIDHKDRDTRNNAIENLRLATRSDNASNRIVGSVASGFHGVWKQKNRWRAGIYKNGKTKYLGYFLTAEEASAAYNEAAKKLHGEFAVAA